MKDRKVALITGSAKGLGKMTATVLAEMGCDIIVNYVHSGEAAAELVRSIEAVGVRSIAVQADISRTEDVARLVAESVQSFGRIDILVNNAGPFIRERKLFTDYTPEEIRSMLYGNLTGVIELDHLVLPMMRRQGGGRIIHFGFSRASEAPGWPHRAVYAAAKVGLVSFTKTLAVEEAANGITVNMIGPGDISGGNKEKRIAEVEHLPDGETPRGRPGSGEDIARMIAFLCRKESDFITGNIIDVSGGLDPIRSLNGSSFPAGSQP